MTLSRVMEVVELSKDKKKRECPLCGTELDEDDEICPECGSLQEESSYDAIADEED